MKCYLFTFEDGGRYCVVAKNVEAALSCEAIKWARFTEKREVDGIEIRYVVDAIQEVRTDDQIVFILPNPATGKRVR